MLQSSTITLLRGYPRSKVIVLDCNKVIVLDCNKVIVLECINLLLALPPLGFLAGLSGIRVEPAIVHLR